ncbi:MAG: helix-turn-helix domain-containing protein, partial [Patescibacteria group bacterium]
MEKSAGEILKEQMGIKGFSIIRLQQTTGIPERFLIGLVETDLKNLPAKPYVRGYLLKVALALDINGEEFWKKYNTELEVHSSGLKDRLPTNRFAIKNIKKKWVVIGLTSAILLTYGVLNLNRIVGSPMLAIYSPSEEITITATALYSLSGKINPEDTLKINEEGVLVDTNGEFNRFYNLHAGINTFEISTKRLLGRETKV